MTLPGYEARRAIDMQWAFSTKKQTDYDTALLDEDITLTHPLREPSVAEISKEYRSDKETYGKGHEFATSKWEVARDVRFTRTVDGSTLILGWLLAFTMGSVTTTQPDGTGHTNTYLHTFSFFDPTVTGTAQLPVTTIVENIPGAIKRALVSMAISSLTISAEGFELLNATAEFIGSGETAASTLSMPSMPTLHYLSSNYATVKLGDSQEDITTRVRSWSVWIWTLLQIYWRIF